MPPLPAPMQNKSPALPGFFAGVLWISHDGGGVPTTKRWRQKNHLFV